ncbi:MAG: hypothetical protein RSB25_16825 [Acinetobacter sp.]
MNITKSMLEKDAADLMQAMKKHDYTIPSSLDIFKPILKVYRVVCAIQIMFSAIDYLIYKQSFGDYYLSDVVTFSLISLLLVFIVLSMTLYGGVSLTLCIPDKVKKESLILKIAKKKLKIYFYAVIIANIIVAAILLFSGGRLVTLLGGSWFVSLCIGSIMFSASMSRYLTPTVMATINKVHETITSGKQTA